MGRFDQPKNYGTRPLLNKESDFSSPGSFMHVSDAGGGMKTGFLQSRSTLGYWYGSQVYENFALEPNGKITSWDDLMRRPAVAQCGRAGVSDFPPERPSESDAQISRIASSSPNPSGTAGLGVFA